MAGKMLPGDLKEICTPLPHRACVLPLDLRYDKFKPISIKQGLIKYDLIIHIFFFPYKYIFGTVNSSE